MAGRFITAFVASQPDLVLLLGTRVRDRQARPEDQGKDYLVYRLIDTNKARSLSGPSGLSVQRYQIDIVSLSNLRARRIARMLAGTGTDGGDPRMDGFRGLLGGITVKSCTLEDERDQPETPQSGEAQGLFTIQQDYMIAWNESLAAVP